MSEIKSEKLWQAQFSRRSVLKAAAAGVAVTALQSAFRLDALAYENALREGLQVFNPIEAETVTAVAARIWPGDDDDPGAREAGVVHYIDRALAGPYSEDAVTYHVGLLELDAAARERHDAPFRDLTESQQDGLLTDMDEGATIDGFDRIDPQSFFGTMRTHTMEGLFADPIYGGNRDFAGWRAVGYPGPYYLYTAEEQQSFEPLDKPFQSVADL